MIILHGLEFFRTALAGRPLVLLVAAVVVLALLRRRVWTAGASWTIAAPRIAAGAGIAGGVAYVALAVFYASADHYFDNAEPTMTAVGWLFHVGQPVYHSGESAERYAHIYGPAAFIAHGVALAVFGPAITASKAVGATAAVASLALLVLALRAEVGFLRALVLTGVCALLLLLFRNYSFWTRPEPLQLACVAAALLAAVRAKGVVAGVLVGVCAGILWNLKLTGPLYVLPIFVLLQRRAGWTPSVLALATSAGTALLPFVLFANVSWDNYLHWVRLSGRTGLLLSTLRMNIEWAVYLSLPILLSYYAAPAERRAHGLEWRLMLFALGLGICGVVLAAAKPGAGPYHLIPFVPLIVFIAAYQLKDTSPADVTDPIVSVTTIALVGVTSAVGVAQQAQFLSTMVQRATRDEASDIARVVRDHPGVVEMGYGSSEVLSLQRPLLVFRNHFYSLDQPAVREHQLAGLELPAATIQALRECRVNYWLIPKGESPFSGRNAYDAVLLQPLFSEEFRRVFHETHELTATTTYFDAWRCHARSSR
jgi:hypothetical protein